MKQYYEYEEMELRKHLKYWSNACGELHHHGEYDLNDVSELPEELQRAYNELWKEGNGCYEYLVEFDDKYYIALVSEFGKEYANDMNISVEEMYQLAKRSALELYHKDLFKSTTLVIGKETGFEECYEIIFLVPAMESENVYDKIEDTIYQNIYKNIHEKNAFEKILERLDESSVCEDNRTCIYCQKNWCPKILVKREEVKKIVQEVAEEYNKGGWIACSEKLPEESGYYLVTYHEWSNGNYFPKYDDEYVTKMDYQVSDRFTGWNYSRFVDEAAEKDINREVLAWQPLPECFKRNDLEERYGTEN